MKNQILTITLFFLLSSVVLMAQPNINKSFDGVKKIKMSTASGSCKIKKGKDAKVTVNLEHTFDNRYEPSIELEGDRLVIKENFKGNNNSGTSRWTLSIPDGIPFSFATGSGDLEAADIKLDLDASTGSGNLSFINVNGKVEASTGSGDVELITFNGDIRANTGSGNMRVEKCLGDINLNCGSGNLRLADNKGAISANTGSGNISARNLILEGSSSFNTGSGDADVTLGATPKFDLSVNSGSGDAELNFNGNEIKGEIVMRANKKNGKIVAPFEFDKTEEIDNNRGDNVTIKKTVVKGNGSNKISVGTGSGSAVLRE